MSVVVKTVAAGWAEQTQKLGGLRSSSVAQSRGKESTTPGDAHLSAEARSTHPTLLPPARSLRATTEPAWVKLLLNVFHGRMHGGRATFGDLSLQVPGYPDAADLPAKVYMRPHELEIRTSPSAEPSFPARVRRINSARPTARVFLLADDDREVTVDLPAERLRELDLREAMDVYVFPKTARVFVPDYSI
ncbi:MAG: TOBE-like domain-containing protein [Planctomycetia bacterium]|nr:TOBE-like domain-containing protein [Planctomycetia bacterium]